MPKGIACLPISNSKGTIHSYTSLQKTPVYKKKLMKYAFKETFVFP